MLWDVMNMAIFVSSVHWRGWLLEVANSIEGSRVCVKPCIFFYGNQVVKQIKVGSRPCFKTILFHIFSLFFEGPILISILYCPLLTLEKDGHASKKDTLWFWYWNIHHFVDRLSFTWRFPIGWRKYRTALDFMVALLPKSQALRTHIVARRGKGREVKSLVPWAPK